MVAQAGRSDARYPDRRGRRRQSRRRERKSENPRGPRLLQRGRRHTPPFRFGLRIGHAQQGRVRRWRHCRKHLPGRLRRQLGTGSFRRQPSQCRSCRLRHRCGTGRAALHAPDTDRRRCLLLCRGARLSGPSRSRAQNRGLAARDGEPHPHKIRGGRRFRSRSCECHRVGEQHRGNRSIPRNVLQANRVQPERSPRPRTGGFASAPGRACEDSRAVGRSSHGRPGEYPLVETGR